MLQIESRELDTQTAAVILAGKIMLGAESEAVEQRVAQLLKEGKKYIICDLTGVTHIDSTGIGRFISSLNMVMNAGAKLLMAGATGAVRQAFHVTLLDTVFQFYSTIEDAQASLR